MDAYLCQLKEQQTTLQSFLNAQRENMNHHTRIGVRMTVEIYIQILEDALATTNSTIQYLERK